MCCIILVASTNVEAGNPDRQGEAGALQLLLNPWAMSSGLHTLNTASISGVEAARLNVGGLSFINQTQLTFSRGIYLDGSEVYMNAAGIAQRVGKNGVLGLNLMAMDFGDIDITTVAQPEGTGGQFSPLFSNIGLSYAHLFVTKAEKDGESDSEISVGGTVRVVSESSSNVSANGIAIDAGIQYRNENMRLGISLRNVGTPLRYTGEGMSVPLTSPNGTTIMTVQQRAGNFELPSTLNIGAAYVLGIDTEHQVTAMANFTSNTFSRDEIGAGLEYCFNSNFGTLMLRAAYRYELGQETASDIETGLYSGVAAGATIEVPLSKKNKDNRIGFDYSYRTTNVYAGTHNIGVHLNL